MSFLGLAFLIALPLTAAPLVLHLLDRRRNVAIEWGAMQFLMAAAARKTSARRLKQWALLLLRTLAVAALILALARPMIPSGWIGVSDHIEMIFVIDNSMSTARTSGQGSLMQSMLKRISDEAGSLKVGDRVRLLTTAPYPIWQSSGSIMIDSGSTAAINENLKRIEPTQARSDLLAGVMTAVQADAEPTSRQRRIVLLTDGQAADWQLDDTAGWNRFRQRLQSATIPTQLQIIQSTDQSISLGNLAVDEVRARRTRVGINESVALSATIHNYSSTSTGEKIVHWEVAGQELSSSAVNAINANATHEEKLTHSFDVPGTYRISCRIESEDDLVADNTAGVVVEVVEEVPVLIIESESRLADSQQDSFFVCAALGWLHGKATVGKAVYSPTVLPLERIDSIDLDTFHVVVIPNLTQLSRKTMQSLQAFVYNGGGLWVALGSRVNVDEFNQQWFAGGSGLSPITIDRISYETVIETVIETADEQEKQAQTRPPLKIDPFGSKHPAVTQLSDHEQLDLGDVIIKQRFRFALNDNEDDTSVLLSLSNGEPLVVEQLYGSGRVILQAIPLQLHWSDLTRSQAFVVMVREWIDYLSHPRATKFNLQPGEPIVLRVPADGPRSGMLTNPQGDAIELTADGLGDSVLRTNRTSLPGNYRLETAVVGDSLPFQVLRDARESDLSPLRPTDQQRLSELAGIHSTSDRHELVSASPTDPLWPYLLIGLIVLITLELVLAGLLARERFGVSGVAITDHDSNGDLTVPETKFPAITSKNYSRPELVGLDALHKPGLQEVSS